jgi:serine phosphatase RsbU (regulator of sigma subunit)
MFDKVSCAINPARLNAGDILVLYTDGVTEARNSLGEEFGVERLATQIRRGHTLSADALMNRILENITDFARDVGFEDDATILVVKFTFDSM